MIAGLAAFVWAIMASLTRAFRGLDGTVGGFSVLIGGWRSPRWPTGVQEDDPETAWATRREPRPAPPQQARQDSTWTDDPWFDAGDDDGEPAFTSTIELLD